MSLTDSLEYLLSDIAETLDVPPSAHEQAKERYEAVGAWLCADDSPIRDKAPEVYPQGSFTLGTVVRPLQGDDYDIDAVVQLAGSRGSWDPKSLKNVVGDRLKAHSKYRLMLEAEGRRCWTLQYASEPSRHGFHLDLLPSVLAEQEEASQSAASSPTSLAITNRLSPTRIEWKDSDPRGYAKWFAEQVKTRPERRAILSGKVAGVAPVKTFTYHAPLQRAVQLLKRYRDVLFRNDNEHAPISVIITTLAAQAYDGEESLVEAVFGVVNRMSKYIHVEGDVVRIPNPIRPTENFADRWQGDARKARAFLRWLDAAKKLEQSLLSKPAEQLGPMLNQVLGEGSGRAVMEKYASRQGITGSRQCAATAPMSVQTRLTSSLSTGLRGAVSTLVGLLRDAPHRQSPPWQMAADGTTVNLRGFITSGRGARLGEFFSGMPIFPGLQLRFDAEVRGGSYTDIYWQVTNTGAEAERANQLRGQFELGNVHKTETTSYRGDHSVECFVIRDRVCVARSGPFIVSIRT